MNRCCESGYDSQEDKRSERTQQRSRDPRVEQATPTMHSAEPPHLYAVGSTPSRTERRSDFTRGR